MRKSQGPACTNTMATSNLKMTKHPPVIARDHPNDQEKLVTKNLDIESQGIERRKQIQKMTEQHLSTHPKPLWTNQIGINLKAIMMHIQELQEICSRMTVLIRNDQVIHMNDCTTR